MARPSWFPLVLAVFAAPGLAQAPQVRFNLLLGTGEVADSNWRKPPEPLPPFRDGFSFSLTPDWGSLNVLFSLGADWAVAPRHQMRILFSYYDAGGTPFINRQFCLDWNWEFFRHRALTLYSVGGASANNILGTYEFVPGYLPPEGPGDYRRISQTGRPGAKAGVGIRLMDRWAVEANFHYITLSRTGRDAARDGYTSYETLALVGRFGD